MLINLLFLGVFVCYICTGLFLINQFDDFTDENMKPVIDLFVNMWKKIFEMVKDIDL